MESLIPAGANATADVASDNERHGDSGGEEVFEAESDGEEEEEGSDLGDEA